MQYYNIYYLYIYYKLLFTSKMFNKIIIYSFILFLFVIITAHFTRGSTILEGLDSDAGTPVPIPPIPSPSSPVPSSSDIGVTVGTYGAKLDALGKIIDSMQSSILGLLPIVTKNSSDNENNSKAIQAIIANKDKT